MLKNRVRRLLQKVLGYPHYLFVFAIWTIRRLPYAGSFKDFRFFLGLIPDEGIILDIGANIGITALTLARQFPNSQVLAFEPIPDNLEALKKVIRFYGRENIQVFATALGDREGSLQMQVPETGGGRMQGLSRVIENENDTAHIPGRTFRVPVQTLDRMDAIRSGNKISAIKIDVENFEYFVLSGAKETLHKHQPLIFCELWNNERRNLCINLLAELGYRCYVLHNNQLVRYSGQDRLNFFFLH